jgi:hypothetical protein
VISYKSTHIQVVKREFDKSIELSSLYTLELESFQLNNENRRRSEDLQFLEMTLRFLTVSAIYVIIRAYLFYFMELPKAIFKVDLLFINDLFVLS